MLAFNMDAILRGQLVRITSSRVGESLFLKHVGPFIMLNRP